MNNSKLYIIIVTYNGIKWINKCLKSCREYPIIVVDNASTDNTVSFIEKNFPNVILLKQRINLGFGAANNIGISYALNNGAEYVLLLNQDAYLIDNTIDNLVKFHKNNSNYGILSPVHINGNRTKLDTNFANYISFKENEELFSDLVLKKETKEVYNFPFINAAIWLVSKKCLITVGGFDPIFKHYGEDNNYCQRVLYHGFKIGVIINTYAIHDREDRIKNKTVISNKERIDTQERIFKCILANPNNKKRLKYYYNQRKKIFTKALKSLFKLNFSEVYFYFKLKKILRKSFLESNQSVLQTSKKSSHYLNVEF